MFHCASNFRGFQPIVTKGRQTNRNSKKHTSWWRQEAEKEHPGNGRNPLKTQCLPSDIPPTSRPHLLVLPPIKHQVFPHISGWGAILIQTITLVFKGHSEADCPWDQRYIRGVINTVVTHRETAARRGLWGTFMPARESWISEDREVSYRKTNSASPEGNMRKGESCIVRKQCATLSWYGGTFSWGLLPIQHRKWGCVFTGSTLVS